MALLVCAFVTLTAGVCGHLLYRYVLRWRGTVLLSLLLGPLPVLGLLGLQFGSAGGMFEIPALPIDFVARQNWTHRITFSLPIFFSIVVLSIGHPLRPCLTNAIITAIGISLWHGVAILIGASAGWMRLFNKKLIASHPRKDARPIRHPCRSVPGVEPT